MKYFWAYLLCLVSLNGCIVPQVHAHHTRLPSRLVTPILVDNGYHDDDGREHEPMQTRREQLPDALRRENRPDELDDLTEIL
ncbi:hypothetical protein [Acinetobacter sp. MD2]|uniref:hypothetical protein n=1 Tax=Acinetobacter sp. MD2 TaxID=2600066 RepID=UPI002D1F97FE|nr:hypothetical protein [Acinetobacter sp. MD2]MEB3767775.1 hypothetical protein [Acinetobacter sp. MD2]